MRALLARLLPLLTLTGCTVLSGVAALEVGSGGDDTTNENAQTAGSSGSVDGGKPDVHTKSPNARSDPPEEIPPPSSSSSGSSSSSSGSTSSSSGGTPPVPDGGNGMESGAPPPPPPPPPMPVTETFTKSLQEDERFQYGPFNARAGTSVEAITSGNGDPDLYLNFGAPATFGNADCASEGGDADERCRRTTPTPATPAYVMVYAFGPTTYTLRVTYTPGP